MCLVYLSWIELKIMKRALSLCLKDDLISFLHSLTGRAHVLSAHCAPLLRPPAVSRPMQQPSVCMIEEVQQLCFRREVIKRAVWRRICFRPHPRPRPPPFHRHSSGSLPAVDAIEEEQNGIVNGSSIDHNDRHSPASVPVLEDHHTHSGASEVVVDHPSAVVNGGHTALSTGMYF
ncbi:unnamed protein product [Soboliphyme baturini]|uniref:Uncharacterized protein n=1 Tax=Soboliphyme baturini TaxID=241478 RepID=A0A183IH87_9BILA|nr:unnamed protein product [Soboliphyme baturini]